MKSSAKTVLWILGFAAFIGAASLAYNLLRGRVDAQALASVSATEATRADATLLVTTTAATESATASGVSAEAQGTANDASAEDTRIAAPDFTVRNADGDEVALSELFGKPLVLNFWASWCPPCKSEMPEFNSVYEDIGGDITFMMIDLVDGQRETTEKGAAYVEEQGFTFPVYYDTEGEAGSVYGITSIPTTLFIDSEGYVVTGAQGAIDGELLRKGIGMISADEPLEPHEPDE